MAPPLASACRPQWPACTPWKREATETNTGSSQQKSSGGVRTRSFSLYKISQGDDDAQLEDLSRDHGIDERPTGFPAEQKQYGIDGYAKGAGAKNGDKLRSFYQQRLAQPGKAVVDSLIQCNDTPGRPADLTSHVSILYKKFRENPSHLIY